MLALGLSGALLLGGCSSGGEDDASGTSAPSAADRLAQAHAVLLDAGSVHLALAGADLPEDVKNYVISADGSGTMDPPAFTGTITARVAGIQADVPTVAVDGDLWVKLPYTPAFVRTDPDVLNVPDPATLLDPESGLVGLLPQTLEPAFGGKSRVGAEVVQEITGSLPGEAVTQLLRVGDNASDFDVTYGLVETSWEVRTVAITGPFYPPATSTYTLTFDDYGVPVTVTKP